MFSARPGNLIETHSRFILVTRLNTKYNAHIYIIPANGLKWLKSIVKIRLSFEWANFAFAAQAVSALKYEGGDAQQDNHEQLQTYGCPHPVHVSG